MTLCEQIAELETEITELRQLMGKAAASVKRAKREKLTLKEQISNLEKEREALAEVDLPVTVIKTYTASFSPAAKSTIVSAKKMKLSQLRR